MTPSSVFITYCYGDNPKGLFHESMVQLLIHDANHLQRVTKYGDVISLDSGPRIHANRNVLTKRMYEDPRQPEWLFMVDADMTLAPDTLDRMVEAAESNDIKILGGLCFAGGRSGTSSPTLYQLVDPKTNNGDPVRVVEDYPADSLVKVDATGAACLLIHRTVLDDVLKLFGSIETPRGTTPSPSPWWAETIYHGKEMGEDWTFCMRAGQAGHSIYVHTGIKFGHVKRLILDEVEFQRYLAEREELGSKEAVLAKYHKRAMGY